MNQSYTKDEWAHVGEVKSLPCSVCDHPPPSIAHHIKQDSPWSCVALCYDCHKGGHNGIHEQRAIWNVMKMDEHDGLYVTFERLRAAWKKSHGL